MKRMNFNHLYYFMVIAKKGSIAKASSTLFLTQSTLSDQLRQFEEYLGHKLFDRKPRKLILNEAGRIALDYASKVFGMAEEMEKALHNSEEVRIETLRLGIIPSLPKSHVHEFLEPLWKLNGVGVSIIDAGLDHLVKEIEIMNLDMVLSDVSVRSPSQSLINRHLMSRKIVAVAHPKFKALKKNFPYSLNQQPFLNFTKHSQLRFETDQYFKANKINPDVVGEVDDITLARLSIEKGVGFCLLPKKAIEDSIRSRKAIILGTPKGIKSDMWAITSKAAKTHESLLKAAVEFRKKHT